MQCMVFTSILSGPGDINVTLVLKTRNLGSNQYNALPQAPFSDIALSVGLQGSGSIVLNSIHFLLSLISSHPSLSAFRLWD